MSNNNIFLKKAAIETILELSKSKGIQFNELVRRTQSTSITISNRLKELRRLNLVEIGLVGDKRVYRLTDKGKRVIPTVQKISMLLDELQQIVNWE